MLRRTGSRIGGGFSVGSPPSSAVFMKAGGSPVDVFDSAVGSGRDKSPTFARSTVMPTRFCEAAAPAS